MSEVLTFQIVPTILAPGLLDTKWYTFFNAVRVHSGNLPSSVLTVIGFHCRSVSVAMRSYCLCRLKMTDSNIEHKVYVALVGLLRFIMFIQNT